jgi:hypothetical protein
VPDELPQRTPAGPLTPPRGWTVLGGVLTPDPSVDGWLARRQEAAAVCRTGDCRRRCFIDLRRLHRRGWGGVSVDEYFRVLRCARPDGCSLELVQDLKTGRLPLRLVAAQPLAKLRASCRRCPWTRTADAQAWLEQLQARGLGDRDTDPRDLPAKLGPCKGCGARDWRVEVLWPDGVKRWGEGA